jgi:predicted house-cleaning NTP pyrophosphatase (Maf/HAM1 superfamily)
MSIVIPRLILASASPRRRELLAQAGFVFDVIPAHIPEEPREGEAPTAYVMRLAREKAETIYAACANTPPAALCNKGTTLVGPQAAPPDTPGIPASANTPPDTLCNKGTTSVGPQSAPPNAPGFSPCEGSQPAAAPGDLVILGADTTVTLDGHILEKPRDADDAKRMLRILSGRTHLVITGVAVVDSNGIRVAAETTAVWFAALTDDEIAEYVASGEPMDKAGAYGIQGRAAKWIPRIEGCYFNVVGLPLALVSSMLETRLQATGNRDQNGGQV